MLCRYLFALVDAGGNVTPELHAARRLIERGHTVSVIADDSVASDVCSAGAEFLRWARAPNRVDRRPENDPARDWECKYPWQLFDRLTRTLLVGPAERYAIDVHERIAERRPAVVVCSMFCCGGMVAAEAARIPFVVLFPNIYPLPARDLPPFGAGLRPSRGAIGLWRDQLLNAVIEGQWDRKGLAGVNAIRARYGLAPVAHVFDQVRRAQRQLVMTSPSLDFPATLPIGARYVGPVLDDPQWSEGMPWVPPPGTDPLVLVAMSSTFQDQIASLQRVIDALSTLPVRALVTAGPALDVSSLQPARNVTVVASAPHRQVLGHTAVVITHAGHGTVVKALAAGVPLVMLPHGRDQADTAVRVSTRGAGVTLKRSAGADTIAAAVSLMLRNASYRAAAQRLGDIIRRDAATDALVDELEAAANRDCGSHTELRRIS